MSGILDYDNLLFIDLETTGLDYKKDRVIEIGIYNLNKTKEKRFEPANEISRLIKFDGELSEKIIELTGITDNMLKKDGVDEYIVVNELLSLITDKTLLIAYNSQFDNSFVSELIRRVTKDKDYKLPCHILDVMAFYKDWYEYPHRLKSAIEKLEIDNAENTHRALDDAKATYEVLRKLFGVKDANFEDYINVIGYNPKYGVSGEWLREITYIGQYGGKQEIKKYNEKMKGKQEVK